MSKATTKPRNEKTSAFLTRAERAFQRASKTVISESRSLGLKPVAWTAEKTARTKKKSAM